MGWLAGFTRVEGRSSGAYTGGPRKLVLHSTEGSTAAGALGAYRSHGGWPHFTVDPGTRERFQHVSTSVASRALRNGPNPAQTNRDGAVQVEIVGFAGRMDRLPADQAEWLGREVVGPICREAGIPITDHGIEWVPYPESYGTRARQRFSVARWDGFAGICGHQHVPDSNDHGDPGAIPISTILAAAGGEEIDMAAEERIKDHITKTAEWLAIANAVEVRAAAKRITTHDTKTDKSVKEATLEAVAEVSDELVELAELQS